MHIDVKADIRFTGEIEELYFPTLLFVVHSALLLHSDISPLWLGGTKNIDVMPIAVCGWENWLQ